MISRLGLLRMNNIPEESCSETRNTYFIFNIFSFENRDINEIMGENIVERDRPLMTIWRIPIACWIPMATNTRANCVIFITFPLQQWLQ